MKSMVIGGIILIIALMAGTYFVAGDAFISDDYINSLTMLGAVSIITITVFVALKYVNQMKNDTASGELAMRIGMGLVSIKTMFQQVGLWHLQEQLYGCFGI